MFAKTTAKKILASNFFAIKITNTVQFLALKIKYICLKFKHIGNICTVNFLKTKSATKSQQSLDGYIHL